MLSGCGNPRLLLISPPKYYPPTLLAPPRLCSKNSLISRCHWLLKYGESTDRLRIAAGHGSGRQRVYQLYMFPPGVSVFACLVRCLCRLFSPFSFAGCCGEMCLLLVLKKKRAAIDTATEMSSMCRGGVGWGVLFSFA